MSEPEIKPGDPLAVVPVENQDEAIRAYKVANLAVEEDTIILKAVYNSERHEPEAYAKCRGREDEAGKGHTPPASGCTCGFYAKKTLPELKDYFGANYGGGVIMEVDMAGTVLVHEQGIRAGHQRILKVLIPGGQCTGVWCNPEPHLADRVAIGGHIVTPICGTYEPKMRHMWPTCKVMNLVDLKNRLGISVAFQDTKVMADGKTE